MMTNDIFTQSLEDTQNAIANFLSRNKARKSLTTAFGSNFEIDLGISLLASLAVGDLEIPIELVSQADLNNARGAYSSDNNTIYLTTELLESNDIDIVTRTLLEEIGHYVDDKVNSNDASGDEGAIFVSLVLGEELGQERLELLQAENDTAIVGLDGETRLIEQDGIVYVDAEALGNNDGSSWDNAYNNLQTALIIATPGSEIWVAEGTYRPTTSIERNVSFVIPSDRKIYGGFAGGETELSARDVSQNITILSGDIGTPNNNTDNSYHVVNLSGTTAETVLDGFLITNGNADSIDPLSTEDERGGGIFSDTGNAVLSNLTIANNRAASGGGMSLDDASQHEITDVLFIDNVATEDGGAINSRNSSYNLSNVRFYRNYASFNGGAIYKDDGSNATMNNVEFNSNQAGSFGGAIYNSSTSGFGINNTFANNQAENGAAVYSSGGDDDKPEFVNSIFWNNTATVEGENTPIFDDGSNTVIRNSIVQGGYEGLEIKSDDPLFVNLESGNLRIKSGSPAIDAGLNDDVIEEQDLAGNPRIVDSTVDIGAYEFSEPYISIDDPKITVSNTTGEPSADGEVTFTIKLVNSAGETAPQESEITIDYSTLGNTAVVEEDYVATSGTLTFAAGETEKTVTVPILGNTSSEAEETFTLSLSNPTGDIIDFDSRGIATISNENIELFRFRNTAFESGTYVFVGAEERDAILADDNLNQTFSLDGLQDDDTVNPAFIASLEPGEDLIPFYRLASLDVLGTFLFVSTGEYDAIFAEDSLQRDKWDQQGLDREGEDIPEFYLLDGSADRGSEFNRFQNTQNGTFLYAGEAETNSIENDSNLSSLFNNQGIAFKSFG